LATERYVDEDEWFFALGNDCLNWAVALNDQLNCWSSERASTEAWLLKSDKVLAAITKQLKAEVKRARDALRKRF